MRRLTMFACAGETLAATIDPADGATGLLIVSGGNELRIGAHRGMAALAGTLAAAGVPVFRFDRRGIGDSTGANHGYLSSGPDIAAAAAAFRALHPGLSRIVAFGNCDAATALALFGASAGIDALILANPWVIEASGPLPPPAAIRARYAARLRDPATWRRLLSGGVDLRKLASGLGRVARTAPPGLAERLAGALARDRLPITILLARRDNTAIAFADAWKRSMFDPVRGAIPVRSIDSASHSFAGAHDKAWLTEQLRGLVDRPATSTAEPHRD